MSFFKKTFLLLFFIVFGYASLMIVFVSDDALIENALADANDKISGYAWNDTTGWISFNCTNQSCASTDYGVTVDLVTGNLYGYAWSSNLGWIYFGSASDHNTPGAPQDPQYYAQYNSSSGEISGWAKILSMGSEGWIKLRKYSTDGGVDYGVSINSGGEFEGFGWNSNIGWVSFNSDNCDTDSNGYVDSGACGGNNATTVAYEYGVSGDIISQPQNVVVSQASIDSCHRLKVVWDTPVMGASGFKVYRKNGASWDTACSWIISNVCNDETNLSVGTSYTYKVRACYDQTCATYNDSNEASGSTNSICEISDITGRGECPNSNYVSWGAPSGVVDYYNIYRCDMSGQAEDYCSDTANYSNICPSSNCSGVTSASYNDVVGDGLTSHRLMYIVAGYNSGDEEEGDWSEPFGPYVACPKSPLFKEVRPE